MIKKYLEFINENSNKLFTRNKEEVSELNNIIKDKLNLEWAPNAYSKERMHDYNKYENGEVLKKCNHDVFCIFFMKDFESLTVDQIKEKLVLDFDYIILQKNKEPGHYGNTVYSFSCKLKDLLKSNIIKSLRGINKYNL
jgi:hypothetical protein